MRINSLNRYKQGGSSLPVLSILLLIIAVLTYLLGWLVLVGAVVAFWGITLAVYIYDKLRERKGLAE